MVGEASSGIFANLTQRVGSRRVEPSPKLRDAFALGPSEASDRFAVYSLLGATLFPGKR